MIDQSKLDSDKIDEVALALLGLTMHANGVGMRAWKSIGWDVLDRLHAKGWIGDPKTRAKSVVLTQEGQVLAEEHARRHFAFPE